MRNHLDGHLVGFEAIADLEEASPGCFEEEFTDYYGEELIHKRIGDGSEAYDAEVERNQKKRPRKVTTKSCIILANRQVLPVYTR